MYIFNTQSRRKEEFVPLHEGEVRMYCCGPTVYNYFHLGNARPFVFFDTLRRYLEWCGYKVNFVQNFTDIDDKMINRANEEGITVKELGERFIKAYFEDTKGLGIRPATVHPKATEHIGDILALIQKLFDNHLAYEAEDGVYFDTTAFPGYLKLSGQSRSDLESGARVDVVEGKHNPMDFAIWKKQKPGEPAWDSPWGKGRPGWHIECSAMSMKYLGETLDIHAGGQDLIFPHHENEIAQSEGATGKPFVRYWMHNGFINVNNEKMAKSKGNFFTIRDIAQHFNLEAVRLFLLSSHYRSPINYTDELIQQSQNALDRIYTARNNYRFLLEKGGTENRENTAEEEAFLSRLEENKARFKAQMDDDFNTAGALGVLFDYIREANAVCTSGASKEVVEKALALLLELCGVMGLLYQESENADEKIEALLQARQEARKAKDWKKADAIRDEIKAMGYVIEDTPQGPKARKA